jgi:deoxycytidylate deaminase
MSRIKSRQGFDAHLAGFYTYPVATPNRLKNMDLEVIGTKPMDKWDKRFVELSKFVSNWSKDPKAPVGAVVVSNRGGAVSTGYNGFPIGVEDSAERLEDNEMKLELVVHAEQNALINAGSRAENSTIYGNNSITPGRDGGCQKMENLV